jgi:hypothetical protein
MDEHRIADADMRALRHQPAHDVFAQRGGGQGEAGFGPGIAAGGAHEI